MDNSDVEPSEAINALEAALRGLIHDVLGSNWQDKSGLDVEKLEQRRTEEAARRKGSAIEQNLLAYTHIYEIRKIIEKNWEQFKPALVERKRFDVYMDRVEDFRNAPMHSRELLPFEKDLLAGVAGEIRNLATLFRSQQAPDRQHYPVVESIVDSFGNEMSVSQMSTSTGMRLKVGEKVQFACRAWDAQDRIIKWEITTRGRSAFNSVTSRAEGSSVTLNWTVSTHDVAELASVEIEMSSTGKYHRSRNVDFSHTIFYSVDPPNDFDAIEDHDPREAEINATTLSGRQGSSKKRRKRLGWRISFHRN